MPPKRPRRAELNVHGLAAGERLKRTKLAGSEYLAWCWVGTEVNETSQITEEHRLTTCGFSDFNPYPFCTNKYLSENCGKGASKVDIRQQTKPAEGELDDDIIVVSDEESPSPACNNKLCKTNPNCLNYLGQDRWENEEKARNAFMQAAQLGPDPTLSSRADRTPVGLKNLGATCYANAFLQVWFQDLPFRTGVYGCQPSSDEEQKFEESPIFQLQVTFAALQTCKEATFNPVKLVESLKLRTTEQQDAQEFSKLFMAHLDNEFQKQADPALKSFVADQFQGKLVYVTVCSKCHNRSERESEFLEVEVNLTKNSKLEDRIEALLQPEELTGDNKYLCPRCESLQNAKRYTEFRELPPVMHVSLLRFVYDLSTMERKKSKHAIAFPLHIHMNKFIKDTKAAGQNEYDLRGILLHKGASAYHGHYEAQIFDVRHNAWYQFNDEVVTRINSLGPRSKAGMKGEVKSARPDKAPLKPKKSGTSQKAAKAENGVDTFDDFKISKSQSPVIDDENYIISRDAYMLVYVRSSDSSIKKPGTVEDSIGSASVPSNNGSVISGNDDPVPPPRAAEFISGLNVAHDKACADYNMREKELEAQFNTNRRTVRDIYQSWDLSSNSEENRVVSRQALETWLSRHLTPNRDKASKPSFTGIDTPIEISNTDIVCSHGGLDPTKSGHMKRIKKSAADRILLEDGCQFAPSLKSSDVCEQCVRELFSEKLYQIEHPRLVSLFDDVCQVDENDFAYWISKGWLKDWRQSRPRMHRPSQADPSPGEPEYEAHVKCEHGYLTPNMLSRRRISPQAFELLKGVFPDWLTLTTDTEICATCEALAHISKEDRREAKIQAEEEKARLRQMFDNALNGGTGLLENVPCAVMPSHFVRSWKQWLFHPAQAPRPDEVDTAQFICQHGLLILDPNAPGDFDDTVAIITKDDWDVLQTLYPCGPLIAVENTGSKWSHEPAVCRECRLERKSSYETTEITIRVLRAGDPIPTEEPHLATSPQKQRSTQTSLLTYGSRTRQSKRIRQRDPCKRKKVTITRVMTVKALKIKVQEELGIPTIYQHLYHHGRELDENSATISALGILANDVIDLREDSEDIDLLGSGSDHEARRAGEGLGFGGTLLAGGGSNHPSSSPPPAQSSDLDDMLLDGPVKACPACTFENPPDVRSCTVCNTPFNS